MKKKFWWLFWRILLVLFILVLLYQVVDCSAYLVVGGSQSGFQFIHA
jgi:hypothetical protein